LGKYCRVLKPGAITGVSVYFNVSTEWKVPLNHTQFRIPELPFQKTHAIMKQAFILITKPKIEWA